VGLLHIHFGNSGVMTHHVQGCVAEKRLQSEYITASTQVSDGKGVAEFVRVRILDPGTICHSFDHLPQGIGGEGPIFLGEKYRVVRGEIIFAVSQVTPNRPPGRFPQENRAAFPAFCTTDHAMFDLDAAGFAVYITDAQLAQFSVFVKRKGARLLAEKGRVLGDSSEP
jgi:hypothetical protein